MKAIDGADVWVNQEKAVVGLKVVNHDGKSVAARALKGEDALRLGNMLMQAGRCLVEKRGSG